MLDSQFVCHSRMAETLTVSLCFFRFWEAIKKWDAALELTPNDEKVYEMKAQVQNCSIHHIFWRWICVKQQRYDCSWVSNKPNPVSLTGVHGAE